MQQESCKYRCSVAYPSTTLFFPALFFPIKMTVVESVKSAVGLGDSTGMFWCHWQSNPGIGRRRIII